MRTKALLCCAALAAGLATSAVAQSNVYSLNIVGYVNTSLTNGFTLISNPLDNGTNDLNSLFPSANLGDTIYKWGGTSFNSAVFFGTWSPDAITPPGQGFFYQAGAVQTNTFVGNVMTGSLTNHINAGFNLVANQAPVSDTLDNLKVPATLGDTVYLYRNGGYVSSTFFGTWTPSLSPGVGEGFWVNAASAEDWVQTFNP